ncbi:sigma-70 family RNA polymerase sigma factor [Actinotalea sp. BY-33]|uniref:Sigma-70 family RNA polymerase sigma factor n=1 Tax=Actinotalea soli TaxID=2819234 RepID=A0A939LRP3_9CELL|nr:sigma-70 family RNA polymerase sigma factor [Actinotalea soli]MBO1751820.1 sigma-70 family RNA polymerase sigma factor [Actinotalea soli]
MIGTGDAGRPPTSGDDVISRAQAGSPEAFTQIYQELAGPVAAYVRSKGVPDPADVTSEVFLAVFTGIQRFSGTEVQLRSWVFTIAHRRVIDTWRRQGRGAGLSPYEPEEDTRTTPSAEDGALGNLGEERVHALLATLTDEQREVMTLRIVADLTVEQVAEVVGRRTGAVKALQRRALASLRRALEAEGVPL